MKAIQIISTAIIATASLYAGYKYKEIGNTTQQQEPKKDTIITTIQIKTTIDSAQWKYYNTQRIEAEKKYKKQMQQLEKDWAKRKIQMDNIIDEGLQIGTEKKMQ